MTAHQVETIAVKAVAIEPIAIKPAAVEPIADIAKPRAKKRAATWAATAVLVASVPLTLAWIGLLGWLLIHLIRLMV